MSLRAHLISIDGKFSLLGSFGVIFGKIRPKIRVTDKIREPNILDELWRTLNIFKNSPQEAVRNAFDILIVSFVIYRLLVLVRGTRAWRIVGGVIVFVLFLAASAILKLDAVHWIMDKATLLGPVALVILLLPELRQGLEQVGQIGLWPKSGSADVAHVEARTIEELIAACAEMAETRTGALIVVERLNPLDEIIATGIPVDAQVTAALLGSLFYGQNPLHDGAVVIRKNRVLAAACRLPLSERNVSYDPFMHMRHKAAVGVTEVLDCVTIVVSEERGTISVVIDGSLKRVQIHELREVLNRELRSMEPEPEVRTRKIGRSRAKEKDVESRVS